SSTGSSMTQTFSPANTVQQTIFVGTLVTAGTESLTVNNVASMQLMPQTTVAANNNPLSPGSTYTVQVTGTDGASTTASGKSS
ncbi:MAG: hypothetical protein ACYCPP_09590, partial [Nitrososphaerales archaeon]